MALPDPARLGKDVLEQQPQDSRERQERRPLPLLATGAGAADALGRP
jgi:hypothetical protein